MENRWGVKFVACYVLLLLAVSGMRAQSIVTGAVSGRIMDPTGAVVPNATVTLTNTATSGAQTTTTKATGVYLFPLLKPGDYSITVQETGFLTAMIKVKVLLGQTTTADLKLELGVTTQHAEVSEAGGIEVQTEDGNVSSNFDTRQVENVPNPEVDLLNLSCG